MKRRLIAGLLTTLVVGLGVPVAYLAVHYGEVIKSTTTLSDEQSRAAAEQAVQRRAADLALALAGFLSQRGDMAPETETDLAQMIPPASGAVAELQGPAGDSLIRTGPLMDAAVTGEATVISGRLRGNRVIVQMPVTYPDSSTRSMEAEITSGLTHLLRGATIAAVAGLLLGFALALVTLRRRSHSGSAATSPTQVTPAAPPQRQTQTQTQMPLDGENAAAADPASESLLDRVLGQIQDAAVRLSPELEITHINPVAGKLLGYPQEELIGQSLAALFPGDPETILDQHQRVRSEGEAELVSKVGQSVSVHFTVIDAASAGHIMLLHSPTESDVSKKRIQYLTRYDALTRVANRMQFQHKLQQAIARAQRNNVRLALLYLDLDRFKDVNDTFGHPVGDRSLEITARRVVDAMDPGTLIGRLAGDEFAIVIDNLPLRDDLQPAIAATARMLLDRVAGEFFIDKQELFVTASIGIAVCPNDADNVVDLIRNADAAMYHAKQSGGNNYGFYTPQMNADAVDRLMLKSELRRALEREEFQVLYQPRVDLRDGRIVGAEALLRWRHPKRGEVPPSVFIPMAEDSSLIFEIGAWVLDQVCHDYTQWQGRLAWPGRVSVNLSLQQLRQRDFVKRIEKTFERHKLTPSCMEFEITESTLMRDGEATLKMLDRLYQLGLHLSIDDFGTGYSSLSVLQHFPIGTLKIDKSFVHTADHEDEPATIVSTIISMGQNLKMDVVAEGVETQEQLDFLRARDCHFGQGHLFGHPLSADEYVDLLVRQQGGSPLHASLFA
ncbi:MAG: EAL domain-containing protein [Gammaproteobacteria bacterium]